MIAIVAQIALLAIMVLFSAGVVVGLITLAVDLIVMFRSKRRRTYSELLAETRPKRQTWPWA